MKNVFEKCCFPLTIMKWNIMVSVNIFLSGAFKENGTKCNIFTSQNYL